MQPSEMSASEGPMLRWFGDRSRTATVEPSLPQVLEDQATLRFPKFFEGVPSDQTAVDLFAGRWASSFPPELGLKAGDAAHFTEAHQPRAAAAAFGGGRLDGFRILDLGPLEGGQTYQMERLGADVVGVEGNAEAYLKCLVAKEILGMRSRFLLGDFMAYMEAAGPDAFDLVMASGVLYHMTRPLRLIELVCRSAPRALVWTHYYDPELCAGYGEEVVAHPALSVPHYRKGYGDRVHGRFWGGLADSACWLRREDIIRAFEVLGHGKVSVVAEDRGHPHGPCFTLATQR
jgi:hypothetical protein